MNKSLKEQLDFIRQNTPKKEAENSGATQAPKGVVTGTRSQTSDTLSALQHLETFKDIVKKDVEKLGLANDFYIITMVNELLKASAVDDQVVSAMGFDRENLLKLQQAIFSIAREEKVSQKMIRGYLNGRGSHLELFYHDLLNLAENSEREDMELRVSAFSDNLDQLHELFEYGAAGKVINALNECSETQDMQKKLAIVKAYGFASETRFHEKDIQGILDAFKNK